MVHLEFGQDRLTEPQPLNTLELAQGAIKGPFEARFVSAVGGCQLLQFRVLGLGSWYAARAFAVSPCKA